MRAAFVTELGPAEGIRVGELRLTSLARTGGARVLAGARPEDAGWCRSAGAAEVVDYRDPELAGRLAALARPGSTCTSTPPATSTCPPRSTCWPTGAAWCASPAAGSSSPCPPALANRQHPSA